MADTQWEKTIDEMVDKNTAVWFQVFSNEMAPQPAGPTLVTNHNYFFDFTVANKGSEVHFERIQARCIGQQNVQLYTDNTYSIPAGRVHLDWPNLGGGQAVTGRIHFRVTRDLTNADIVGYGLYAVVVPEGHVWNTLNWKNRTGPQ